MVADPTVKRQPPGSYSAMTRTISHSRKGLVAVADSLRGCDRFLGRAKRERVQRTEDKATLSGRSRVW